MQDELIEYDGLYDSELATFDMYFASIRSMQFHPGAGTKDHKVVSIEQCVSEAMAMIKARRRVAIGG